MEAYDRQSLRTPPPPPVQQKKRPRRKLPLAAFLICLSAAIIGIRIGTRAAGPAPDQPDKSAEIQTSPETTAPPTANPEQTVSDSEPAPEQHADSQEPPAEVQAHPIDGGIMYRGHIYKLYDLGMTWTEAKALCEDLGGHLVTITSQEEQEAIQQLLDGASRYEYWIGAHYVDGSFTWVTGEPFVYGSSPGAPWSAGQPDHDRAGTDTPEEYVLIFAADVNSFPKYTWNDIMNDINVVRNRAFTSETIGFICEWEPEDAPQENA